MLIDRTEGALSEAREYAESIGMVESLDVNLKTLEQLGKVYGQVFLDKDFAPYSFRFAVRDEKGKFVFNGGLVFHGAHDGQGSGQAPTFSVCLTPTTGWRLHT